MDKGHGGNIRHEIALRTKAIASQGSKGASRRHTEEAFTGGIVTAVTDGAHRTDQGVQLQEALVISAAKLAATIRV